MNATGDAATRRKRGDSARRRRFLRRVQFGVLDAAYGKYIPKMLRSCAPSEPHPAAAVSDVFVLAGQGDFDAHELTAVAPRPSMMHKTYHNHFENIP